MSVSGCVSRQGSLYLVSVSAQSQRNIGPDLIEDKDSEGCAHQNPADPVHSYMSDNEPWQEGVTLDRRHQEFETVS